MNYAIILSETAHIIIDIQNDFCSPDGISFHKGKGLTQVQGMMPKLQEFTELLRQQNVLTIFTKFISNEEVSPGNMKAHWQVNQGKFDAICLPHTKGADLYLLQPEKTDVIIEKRYYDAFAGTNLKEILVQKGIKNIIITGVRTEICVDNTAKRAFSEGFTVFVIEDLVGTNDDKLDVHKAALAILNKYT